MSLAPILRKIFFVDLFKGMKVTFKYQNPKEIYTEQYPLERPQVAERYRGLHRLNNDPDTGQTMCIACDLCALACPEKLIVVKSIRDEATKKKKMTTWSVDLSRCMFCGLCEDACPTDALEMSQDYEFALYSRDGLVLDREQLEKGTEPTVYQR
jgi:NADH-quinone oxidoreductase subunit I